MESSTSVVFLLSSSTKSMPKKIVKKNSYCDKNARAELLIAALNDGKIENLDFLLENSKDHCRVNTMTQAQKIRAIVEKAVFKNVREDVVYEKRK